MYQAVKKIEFLLFCLCSKKMGKILSNELCEAIIRRFGADLVTFEIAELHKFLNPGHFLIKFHEKIALRPHFYRTPLMKSVM